jgi:hypothetical protein
VTERSDRPRRSTVTVLVRALTGPAEAGRVVGHAEVVDTGEVVPLASVDALVELLRDLSRERPRHRTGARARS